MKQTCIFCDTVPNADDKYCAECGHMTWDVRYGTCQVANVGDMVIRMTRRGIGLKAAMGDVLAVHPDETILVRWPHRIRAERMPAKDLCLSFSAAEIARIRADPDWGKCPDCKQDTCACAA